MVERKIRVCSVCKEKDFMESSRNVCKSCEKKQRDRNNKALSI